MIETEKSRDVQLSSVIPAFEGMTGIWEKLHTA
jgi:hypothetical protein